ncbi:hypothetical protein EON66_11060, partial [archaeon]
MAVSFSTPSSASSPCTASCHADPRQCDASTRVRSVPDAEMDCGATVAVAADDEDPLSSLPPACNTPVPAARHDFNHSAGYEPSHHVEAPARATGVVLLLVEAQRASAVVPCVMLRAAMLHAARTGYVCVLVVAHSTATFSSSASARDLPVHGDAAQGSIGWACEPAESGLHMLSLESVRALGVPVLLLPQPQPQPHATGVSEPGASCFGGRITDGSGRINLLACAQALLRPQEETELTWFLDVCDTVSILVDADADTAHQLTMELTACRSEQRTRVCVVPRADWLCGATPPSSFTSAALAATVRAWVQRSAFLATSATSHQQEALARLRSLRPLGAGTAHRDDTAPPLVAHAADAAAHDGSSSDGGTCVVLWPPACAIDPRVCCT